MFFTEGDNFSKWLNSPEYERLKEINRKEINRYPMVVDYAAFKKTPEEKVRLYSEKKAWKANQRLIRD